MKNLSLKNWLKKIQAVGLISIIPMHSAFAVSLTTKMPFTKAMEWLEDSISGDLLLSIAIILIIASCIAKASGEWSDGMRKLINFTFWISIAMGAPTIMEKLKSVVGG